MNETERFKELYHKIPEKERKYPILIIDGKMITWENAFREIKKNTALGKRIIKELKKMEII